MPEIQEIVINTGPLIALVAGLGDLDILKMYRSVYVPFEVAQELLVDDAGRFAATQFVESRWLKKESQPVIISSYLMNALDKGEAAVIQLALDRQIHTVCIDEIAGRRHARLNGLSVTGSIGILLRAKREGCVDSVREAISQMERRGIWLGSNVKAFALRESGEI